MISMVKLKTIFQVKRFRTKHQRYLHYLHIQPFFIIGEGFFF